MVIIRLKNGTDWFKPNWVFRQIADDVIASHSDDRELAFTMRQAQAIGTLFLDSMEERIAAKTTRAIRKVAQETVQGKIQGWKGKKPNDEPGHRIYAAAIYELLEKMNSHAKKEPTGQP